MELMTAHNQYINRPPDERFASLHDLQAAALEDKNRSAERTYNLKDLRVTADGQALQLNSPRGAAEFSHWSFGQTASMLQAPAGFLRDKLNPQLTADVLNYRIEQSAPGSTAVLLVRGSNGTPPMIRACSSETYGRLYDADLLHGAYDHVFAHRSTGTGDLWQPPTDWEGKTAGLYRGDRDMFTIMIDGGSIVTDPSARSGDGGMFRGIMLRNSEVGASSVVIECVLFRYICGNLIIWGASVSSQYRRRHVGKRVLRDVLAELRRVSTAWVHRPASADEQLIRMLIDREIAHTKEAVIDELRAMGATKDQATAAYDACERSESASPRSFWGVAQGLTRESQQTPYQDERYELDKLAGLVLARGVKVAA